MGDLLWDSREFGGIVELISTSPLGRHRDNDYLLVLQGHTMMTIYRSFGETLQKGFIDSSESKVHG